MWDKDLPVPRLLYCILPLLHHICHSVVDASPFHNLWFYLSEVGCGPGCPTDAVTLASVTSVLFKRSIIFFSTERRRDENGSVTPFRQFSWYGGIHRYM